MENKLKIGIIGCGSIGTEIAHAVRNKVIPAWLAAVYDIDAERCGNVSDLFDGKIEITDIPGLVSRVDLVVESASIKALPGILDEVIKNKKPVLIMSVGGLLKQRDLYNRLIEENIKVYLPSGAVAGLDAVHAAGIAGIDSAVLTTRKPPAGLKGAPYIEKNKIDIENLESEKVIFSGNVLEAVEGFPSNINVSAALSIAGIGPEKTKVNIIADPNATTNSHEIIVKGKFGAIFTKTENIPSPSNPKTSYLASLSAISLLKKIAQEKLFCLARLRSF